MKVVIVNSLYPPVRGGSGAEKAVSLLAEALAGRGHEVVVISLHPAPGPVKEIHNGVTVYRMPLDNIYWPFDKTQRPMLQRLAWHIKDRWNRTAAGRVGRILDEEKPDVVNTHNLAGFSASVWREVKRRGIRLVHTTHDYYLVCQRTTLFKSNHACLRRCLECKLLSSGKIAESRTVDTVIAVSRKTLELHKEHRCFHGVRAEVVSNIYLSDHVRPEQKGTTETTVLNLGFIGTLHPIKGIETLLRAVSALRQENWQLKIAGTGEMEYVQQLKQEFLDPRVEWMGFTAPDRFFAAVDVVVIPSLWPEPLPYVYVEALHAGRGIICSNSGGIPELCHLAGRVTMVPAGDVAALGEAISDAIDQRNEWKNVGIPDLGRLEQFHPEQVLNQYTEIYRGSVS